MGKADEFYDGICERAASLSCDWQHMQTSVDYIILVKKTQLAG